jgi:hypothetical protein
MMETTTLDRLYLEWSQFTKARTHRELELLTALKKAARYVDEDTAEDERPQRVQGIPAQGHRSSGEQVMRDKLSNPFHLLSYAANMRRYAMRDTARDELLQFARLLVREAHNLPGPRIP